MKEPDEIKKTLEDEFAGATVEVEDLTGTKDHFQVTVISEAFEDKSLVEQHRMVYAPFNEEIGGPIHAFSIKTFTPEKWQKKQENTIQ
ncbi:MAG: BolA family transcriptional regulator [Candidatus Marinimicrobia bacterium]|nr:BolA family transcriptional regulator [Candidatus Neomarinimicrobiota bacterium]MCF7827605.1 BolA family transcriptional regulator [Candidatus Neomarinimicrobiota bacterium]MCF7881534.1 BolA family transcriptional regulator [Candidatus Neomarinimicrobiota bacterium]